MTLSGLATWPVARIGLYEAVEIPLACLAWALAAIWPRVGWAGFEAFEASFRRFCARRYLPELTLLAVAILARVVLIPWIGTEQPKVADEASLILQAQTWMAGRLANPAHLTPNFEAIYVLLHPAYASMYPVGRSLPMVLGALLGVGYWGGVLITMAALTCAVFWLVETWISRSFAFVAGLIVILRFGLFSFWVNSYFGASLTALGGVLLLVGYLRLQKTPTAWSGAVIGFGVLLLMISRPFEGLLFATPIGLALLVGFVRADAASRMPMIRAGAVAGVFVVLGPGLTAAHDQAVTGHWQTAPYNVYRDQVGQAPALFVQKAKAGVLGDYDATRRYSAFEGHYYERRSSPVTLLRTEIYRLQNNWNFYLGLALLVPFLIGAATYQGPWAPPVAGIVLAGGLLIETWDHTQYASPAFGLVIGLTMLGFHRLRAWSPGDRPVGLAASRLLPLVIATITVLTATAAITGVPSIKPDGQGAACCWINATSVHSSIVAKLTLYSGKHMVFVDTGPRQPTNTISVFNDADPARSRIVWVNADPRYDQQTIAAYPNRALWYLSWTDTGEPCLLRASQTGGSGVALNSGACI